MFHYNPVATSLTQIGLIIGGIALLLVIVFRILLGFWLRYIIIVVIIHDSLWLCNYNRKKNGEDDNKRPPDSIIMMEEYTGLLKDHDNTWCLTINYVHQGTTIILNCLIPLHCSLNMFVKLQDL